MEEKRPLQSSKLSSIYSEAVQSFYVWDSGTVTDRELALRLRDKIQLLEEAWRKKKKDKDTRRVSIPYRETVRTWGVRWRLHPCNNL